jgi:hypothetical protein
MGCADLRNSISYFKWCLLLVRIPNLFVGTNSETFQISSWNIANTCHLSSLVDKLFVSNLVGASSISWLIDHIPEVGVTTHTGRDETHVVLPPVNGSNFLSMALILVVWWALSSVEVINMNSIAKIGSSKQMSSITELNFSATFDLNVLSWSQCLGKNVVDNDLLLDGNDHMESTWMESYG